MDIREQLIAAIMEMLEGRAPRAGERFEEPALPMLRIPFEEGPDEVIEPDEEVLAALFDFPTVRDRVCLCTITGDEDDEPELTDRFGPEIAFVFIEGMERPGIEEPEEFAWFDGRSILVTRDVPVPILLDLSLLPRRKFRVQLITPTRTPRTFRLLAEIVGLPDGLDLAALTAR